MRNRKYTVWMLVFIMACLLLVPGGHASKADTDYSDTALTAEEAKKCLFIGNSLTFFNNSPEMLSRMTQAGTGESIVPVVCVYSGMELREHANAIKAVIRTKGDIDALTETEKRAFHTETSPAFSENVYRGYANLLWDTDRDRPYRFGTIILQIYYNHGTGDVTAERIKNSLEIILDALGTPDTTCVVNASMGIISKRMKLFIKTQDNLDKAVNDGVERAKELVSGKCKRMLIAPTGRAYCNYLLQYGLRYAQDKEPQAYQVYTKVERKRGVCNDLFYGDHLHPTQLGSYLTAATIYSTLYGDPTKTISKYRASVKEYVTLIDGTHMDWTNCAMGYRGGKGFRKDEVLKAAASTAWKTAKKNLRFTRISGKEIETHIITHTMKTGRGSIPCL